MFFCRQLHVLLLSMVAAAAAVLSICGLQYVGSTSTKFRLRFNNHKSRLRAHSRKSYIDKESDDFVYKHFHGPGHHGLRDVSVQIIDKVHNNEKLFIKEGE